MLLTNILATAWSIILLIFSIFAVSTDGFSVLPAILLFWFSSTLAFYLTQIIFIFSSSVLVMLMGTIFNIAILAPGVALIFFTLFNFVISDVSGYNPLSVLDPSSKTDNALNSGSTQNSLSETSKWFDFEEIKKFISIGPKIWGYMDH